MRAIADGIRATRNLTGAIPICRDGSCIFQDSGSDLSHLPAWDCDDAHGARRKVPGAAAQVVLVLPT
jgi:hypothetical protein